MPHLRRNFMASVAHGLGLSALESGRDAADADESLPLRGVRIYRQFCEGGRGEWKAMNGWNMLRK